MLWIPFHSARNRRNFSYWYIIWNQNTVCSTSGQYPASSNGILVILVCFGKYRPKLKIRPICVLGFLHTSQFTEIEGEKKKIQVMDKAQVLPLKLTSSSLCLCHFQREKVRVWDFYEALNKNALECDSAKHPLRIYLVRELQQSACDSIIEKIMQLTCVESNVMNSIPFRPKQMEFLVPVYNLKPEYPLFHLGSKSG